jgi:ABC-type dipeptide/oligopeptide/nickel transport system ATPase subunit
MSGNIETDACDPLVRIENLRRGYVQRRPFSGSEYTIEALENATLTISRGATLALVGDSGSGKSTLARCLALLEKPSAGEIWFNGRNLLELQASELCAVRSQIQLIFQDPVSSLNPRMTAQEIVAEPLAIQKGGTRNQQRECAIDWIVRVGLPNNCVAKRPMEFSGGQRQRLAIARALVLEPKLLILDEALSNLDLANQECIVRLLADLQAERQLTYLHISHDLRMVSQIADEVAVMNEGRVIEQQPVAKLFSGPKEDYTRELLLALPSLESICIDRSA